MKRLLAVHLCINLLLPACSTPPALIQLKDVESYIQDDPYKAYATLQSFDKGLLESKKEKGLYSLLLSMALDKNYIDISSDSLITPAVTYYANSRDKFHRFLTFYYQGRVYENAEDYQTALESYVNAEGSINNDVSKEYLSRLFSRKARVYYHQFANDRALQESRKAKAVSINLDDKRFYVRNCFDEIVYLMACSRNNEALVRMDSLETWTNYNAFPRDAKYYSTFLGVVYTALPEQKDSISSLLAKYLDKCNEEDRDTDHLLLAGVYERLGDYQNAHSELMLCNHDTQFQEVEYYLTLSNIYRGLGRYKDALDAFVQYESTVESINLTVFNNDVRFLEERFEAESERDRSRRIRLTILFFLSILLLVSICAAVLYISRLRRYKKDLAEARNEYGFLKEIMSSGSKPQEIEAVFNARLLALKPFVNYNSSSYSRPSGRMMKNLEGGRLEMLRSAGLIYAMSYPKFVSVLSKNGLNSEEIGLCSLYASGYSTKELAAFPNIGQLYKINVEIRKKLAIPQNGPKLLTWLRDLLAETKVLNPPTH